MVYFILSSILTGIANHVEKFYQPFLFLFVKVEFDVVCIISVQVVIRERVFCDHSILVF